MTPYAGSPAIAPEAREKVLQTFRHTLALAQEGKNEEALLGCDFLLKMDSRFAPARTLLEMLRGVAPGTPLDVERFAEYLGVESAGEEIAEPGADLQNAFDGGPASHPPGAPAGGGLDDLVFGDEPGGHPLPEAPQSEVMDAAPSLGGLDDLRMSMPPGGPGAIGVVPSSAAAPPSPSSPAFAPGSAPAMPGPAPAAAKATSGVQSDPRITQFLKQGDEALARGSAQEAIDLWSRVFLIDLSNEEASRRIDSAREAQAETARKIDMLLTEGVTQFENGDLAGARNKFLDVLALSENDATARGYLNQIEASLASPSGAGGGTPASPSGPGASNAGDSDFMKNEIEAPTPPSFAEYSEDRPSDGSGAEDVGLEPGPGGSSRAARPSGGRRVDVRVLLPAIIVVLLAAAAGAYFLLRDKGGARPANAGGAPVKGGAPASAHVPPSEDPFPKAQALFDAGKIDEAIAVLAKLPESDPRHNEALVRIEKMKSSASPTPGPAAPSSTALDEMRAAGFSALASSRYIDALKNLDPVVKARPQDAEAVTAALRAHEQVDKMGSAARSYNEGDYESAIKLLWELRKGDTKNQDVEEYLVNAYFNSAVQSFQAGNVPKAANAIKEATDLRPGDSEAQRLLRFARKYPKGATDLLSRILIKHLTLRP
jgi:tetratricopeptide (TPR) repeat protein